ncbi:MAG: alpha-D-ribose 1-methylphosphonate 5-triphosphate diphosphatase [Pseudomonadota bacterium]
MSFPLPELRLTGAEILRDDVIARDEVTVANGRFADAGGAPVDLSGYLVLPGIIDLHGDAFERHVAPRMTAPFSIKTGLIGTDRDCAVCGVTTAWIAQSWSWEGGPRGPEYAIALMEALKAYRARAATDLRIQIRCETHTMDDETRLIQAVRRYGIDYVVYNNHLVELDNLELEDFAFWGKKAGRSGQEHRDLMRNMVERSHEVPAYLERLAAEFARIGATTGSHDDDSAEMRARFRALNAPISEFPTGFEAAQAARDHGEPILMGAPNVARGGSQSGNISAMDLVKADLCDALVSDYFYTALADAAFLIADEGVRDLAQAWRMISTTPAEILGLRDRGRIETGLRADLTVLDAQTRTVAGTMAGGRFTHLSGDLAGRFIASAAVALVPVQEQAKSGAVEGPLHPV